MTPETTLRKRAEEQLRGRKLKGIHSPTESNLLKLVHELEVHQVELEMMNEELLIAQEQSLKNADDKYAELYDQAPTGCFTLSKEGEIMELNLCGALMLGRERFHLIKSRFGFFISEDTKPVFNHFLDEIFSYKSPQICEVTLTDFDHSVKYVQLTGIESYVEGQCLITMADISIQKKVQTRLKESEVFLRTAQMVAGLGTFSFDLANSIWQSSEVLDLIFGIDIYFDKSFKGWKSIVHPDWHQKTRDCFHQRVAEQESIFEIEFKIIRRSDQAERWIHAIGQIEFDGQKRPVSLLGTIGDITARKLIEEKLTESEKFYNNLISNLHIGVLVQGPLSEIKLSNSRAFELLGLTEDQLLGKTSFDSDWNVIHVDGTPFPGSTHPVPKCIETRQPVRNEVMGVYRPVTRDMVWLLVNADPNLNSDGSVKEVICTFIDITEQNNIKAELLQSEQRYRTVVESSSNSIVVHREGKIIFANPAAVKMFGATAGSELLGMPIFERIHPDYHQPIQSRIQQAFGKESDGSLMEVKYFRLDGSLIYAEVKGGPIVFDGKPAIQASISDITGRKEAEEKLSQLSARLVLATRAGRIGVWEYNILTKTKIWDDQMFVLYGTDKQNFNGNFESWVSLIHPGDRLRIVNENQMAISGIKNFDTEFRIVWADGTVRNIRALGIVQRDLSGNPLRMIGTNWDITDRKVAEAKIIQKSEELHRVNAEKDKFFSIIAHDLRSPFNGFLGLTQILSEELHEMTPDEISQAALMLKNSASNLFNLLGNLLDWSRLQRDLTPFVPASVLFIDKFMECALLEEVSMAKKQITLIHEIPPALKVVADEDMLGGILRNLLSNCVKFTPPGGIITFSARSLPGNEVEISIKDTGIGMKKEMVDNLFRLDVNTGRKGTEGEPSTGLGLIICNDYIEKHGSKLIVESAVGKGSIFKFSLPAVN